MRILHISTRLILGGSQENTVLSCEGQVRRGHEVHLAFGPIFGPEGSLLERVTNFSCEPGAPLGTGIPPGTRASIATHQIPHLVREIDPLADYKCFRELRAFIRTLKPDVVHTHSSKAGIVGRAAAWAERIPAVIHTIHGPPFHAKLPWHTNRLYIAAERFAAKRCHAIVGVCNAMVEQFVENRIGRPEQYHTVYSGMEIAPLLNAGLGQTREEIRRDLALGERDFVIGTVARLAELKGHDDLLDALADILKANPHWKLLWVGDGWWRQRLIDKARALGITIAELDRPPHQPSTLSPQLIVTGLVPPDGIPGLMRAMDVLVHPSSREGLPRTVPQALLCGTCPIAYDTDGTPEVCKDMKTGRLVRTGDQAGLRGATEWAANNPVSRQTLAARGREECRTKFSAERMVEQLDTVYREVLAKPRD